MFHEDVQSLNFNSETARTNLFLGYFTHIVGRERDWIIAKDLWSSQVIFLGEVFVDRRRRRS